MGDIFSLPLQTSSINVMYTFLALEPNGGHERELLTELYRVAHDYIILFEPAWEFANVEQRERMVHHGYVKDLYACAKSLEYDVVSYDLLGLSFHSLHPIGCMIIHKHSNTAESTSTPWGCPVTHEVLEYHRGCYVARNSGLIYPIMDSIPCLMQNQAMVATKFFA